MASIASTNCGIASRHLIEGRVILLKLEAMSMYNIGIASMNNGMFEIVQYLNKPTPLGKHVSTVSIVGGV